VPPESLRQEFSNPRRLLRASFWGDFKDVLEKRLAAQGEDVFVATLSVRESEETGAYESVAVWSKDVDTILPVPDYVMFFESEAAPVRRGAWARVKQVVGADMEQLPSLPERYRVRTFPTAEQLLAMGAEKF
jgi:hypothetical protein